jgi:hypothetical protein
MNCGKTVYTMLEEKPFLDTFTPRNFKTSLLSLGISIFRDLREEGTNLSDPGSSELDAEGSSSKSRTKDALQPVDSDAESDL